MRIGFLGDVVGNHAVKEVASRIPEIRQRLDLDFLVVNVENAAGGFGVTKAVVETMLEAGADALTSGNHAFDKLNFDLFDDEAQLLRPGNYPPGTAGRGAGLYTARGGGKVLVINMMARSFMEPLDDPFHMMDRQLEEARLGETADAILVDFHGEATAEKMAMGWHLDGRVSLLVGTHTHIPTADTRILPKGTAYQTDSGMCAPYESILGMKIEGSLNKFLTRMPGHKLEGVEEGAVTVCGVFIETDDTTKRTVRAEPIRIGPHLLNHFPDVA
jgi:metallophosphoesterase (TIGR00282 family)